MFIDDQKKANRLGFFLSPLPLAFLALLGCAVMLLGLIEGPAGPAVSTVAAAPLTTRTALHAASFIADQRLVFFVLLGGFLLMACGCFVLSRRSFRDALKAEVTRT